MISYASTSHAGNIHKYCRRHEYADSGNRGWRHTASEFTQAASQASTEKSQGGSIAIEAAEYAAIAHSTVENIYVTMGGWR